MNLRIDPKPLIAFYHEFKIKALEFEWSGRGAKLLTPLLVHYLVGMRHSQESTGRFYVGSPINILETYLKIPRPFSLGFNWGFEEGKTLDKDLYPRAGEFFYRRWLHLLGPKDNPTPKIDFNFFSEGVYNGVVVRAALLMTKVEFFDGEELETEECDSFIDNGAWWAKADGLPTEYGKNYGDGRDGKAYGQHHEQGKGCCAR